MSVYINKSNKTWTVQVKIKDPVTGKYKNYKKRGFKLKREAQRWEAEKRDETTSTTSSFRYMFEEYLSRTDGNKETKSRKKYRIDNYFPFANKELDKISKLDLLDFRDELSGKSLSPTTKNAILSYVRAVYKYASTFYGISDITSVLQNFKRTAPTIQNIWTVDEFNKFISSIDHPVYNAFFNTLYWTGMRRGEAVALLKSDLNNGYLSINKTMSHYANGPRKTKTHSSIRNIKLDNATLNKLQPLLTIPGPYLFGGEYSLPLSGIQRQFKKGTALSGVKRIRVHDLRHSHATNLINSGANIVAVSKRLGHSDINMTLKVYTHLLQKSEDELLNIIGSINGSIFQKEGAISNQ